MILYTFLLGSLLARGFVRGNQEENVYKGYKVYLLRPAASKLKDLRELQELHPEYEFMTRPPVADVDLLVAVPTTKEYPLIKFLDKYDIDYIVFVRDLSRYVKGMASKEEMIRKLENRSTNSLYPGSSSLRATLQNYIRRKTKNNLTGSKRTARLYEGEDFKPSSNTGKNPSYGTNWFNWEDYGLHFKPTDLLRPYYQQPICDCSQNTPFRSGLYPVEKPGVSYESQYKYPLIRQNPLTYWTAGSIPYIQ